MSGKPQKATSVLLMAIMVAGGMTFAFPHAAPAFAQQSNPNLSVSAENPLFNNYFSGAQVIEIVVIDPDIDETNEAKGEPDVTINGQDVRMNQATDGKWYAYFADNTRARTATAQTSGALGQGLDFGTICSNTESIAALNNIFTGNPIPAGYFSGDGVALPLSYVCTTPSFYAPAAAFANNVVREAKTINTGSNIGGIGQTLPGTLIAGATGSHIWPFIQLYDFDVTGNVIIQYNRGGGTQSVTLTYDSVDNFAGIALDRDNYPNNAEVHFAITDTWLNIDPTDEDSWTWDIEDPNKGNLYYQAFDENGELQYLTTSAGSTTATPESDLPTRLNVADALGDLLCEKNCRLLLERDPNSTGTPIVELQNNDDSLTEFAIRTSGASGTRAMGDGLLTITETSSSSGIFASYDEGDRSSLVTHDNPSRGTTATIDYNETPTSILIDYTFATIDIQPTGAVWASGQEIPIVLTDNDANRNSRADEDLDVFVADNIIPTLQTGNPLSLGDGLQMSQITRAQNIDIAANPTTVNQYAVFNGDGESFSKRGISFAESDIVAGYTAVVEAGDTLSALTATLTSSGNVASHNDLVSNVNDLRADVASFSNPPTSAELNTANNILANLRNIPLGFSGTPDSITSALNAYRSLIANLLNPSVQYLGFSMTQDALASRTPLLDSDEDGMTDEGITVLFSYDLRSLGGSRTVDIHEYATTTTAVRDPTSNSDTHNDQSPQGTLVLDRTTTTVVIDLGSDTTITSGTPLIADIMSFGFTGDGEQAGERFMNQIIRLELEETGDDTGIFAGTLEYIMVNQLNIGESNTYSNLVVISDEASLIAIEDLTDEDTLTVTYLDLGHDGVATQVSDDEAAPSHSGDVSFDLSSYKIADTVTITLRDADLNTSSDTIEVYTIPTGADHVGRNAITTSTAVDAGISPTASAAVAAAADAVTAIDAAVAAASDTTLTAANTATSTARTAVTAAADANSYTAANAAALNTLTAALTATTNVALEANIAANSGATGIALANLAINNVVAASTPANAATTAAINGLATAYPGVDTAALSTALAAATSSNNDIITATASTTAGILTALNAHTNTYAILAAVTASVLTTTLTATTAIATDDFYTQDRSFGSPLGRLLDVTFDDIAWIDNSIGNADCTVAGLANTTFTLRETDKETGVFEGDFQIPAEWCVERNGTIVQESVTGLDMEVNYVDFRDASGEIIEVGAGAGIRANTGSVALDRLVYPIPFGDGTTLGTSRFLVHDTAGSTPLAAHDLAIHIRVTDPDFDISASGADTIATTVPREGGPSGFGPIKISVQRGSSETVIGYAGGPNIVREGAITHEPTLANLAAVQDFGPIAETAPSSGVYEIDINLSWDHGPQSNECPAGGACILQGDTLLVEYTDPADASGNPQTVTDSSTFDLRDGVLRSDQSAYIVGSDMIFTLIEPDFDLDNDVAETYTLDLIEWDGDDSTVTLSELEFDPEPTALRETGDSTGIFQVVVEMPGSIRGEELDRGEEIELEYTDWGPTGANYVGEEDEDINWTIYTSNFGATVELDQAVYSWTDKVFITIVAPDHNFDADLIDEIGESEIDPIQITTRHGGSLDNYRLVETGTDTGIFSGEVILTGFAHDADGDSSTGTRGDDLLDRQRSGTGPTDGLLGASDEDGISVSFEYNDDEHVIGTAIIRWNVGDVQWLEASYPASGSGVVRVVDPDMNWNPEAVDNFDVEVISDSDTGGINLTVTETQEASGVFEGTVLFTIDDRSSGHRLRVSEGDTVTAKYDDNTLPDPYNLSDELDIEGTTLIGTLVPPLERAAVGNVRLTDNSGNALESVAVGQQIQVTGSVTSGQDKEQDYAYLVQINNANDVTLSLTWTSGTLNAGQSISPSMSWQPDMAGSYTATVFVWESIDNPTALSPQVELSFTVS